MMVIQADPLDVALTLNVAECCRKMLPQNVAATFPSNVMAPGPVVNSAYHP